MKEFKNVPSKLYEKTENWITKEKNLTKAKYPNNFNESKPKPRRIMSASASHITESSMVPIRIFFSRM